MALGWLYIDNMSARSIGNATISFGLVSIPVKLYSATQPALSISFNLLHGACSGRVKQQYICPREGDKVVGRDELVKGYEFAKDQYVTFTPEELKALEEKATQSIDISEFVPSAKIDPVYFDKAYYLGPDKGGDRAYRLLSEAMQRTGRTALARYAARGKQYLVQLRPAPGGGLVMQQLLYADEGRPFSDVPVEKMADVKDQELKLAKAIVDQIAHDEFKPEQYEDEVKKRVLEQIQRKVEGQELPLRRAASPQSAPRARPRSRRRLPASSSPCHRPDVSGYGAREVARMLGLSVGQVRAWVRAGFLEPERGARGALRFSFH